MIVKLQHFDYLIFLVILLQCDLQTVLLFQYNFIVLLGNFNKAKLHVVINDADTVELAAVLLMTRLEEILFLFAIIV